jgi:hypothetical protein
VGDESPEERAARALGCPIEVYRDAIAALVSLGYTQAAASAAARRVLADGAGPVELDELVKRALAAATGGVPSVSLIRSVLPKIKPRFDSEPHLSQYAIRSKVGCLARLASGCKPSSPVGAVFPRPAGA